MRFRRGRRRQTVQWLPPVGTLLNQNAVPAPGNPLENPSPIEFVFATTHGAPTTLSAPLITDNPVEETFNGAALTVYQNTGLNQTNRFGYKLVRIVGDIFFMVGQNAAQATVVPSVLIRAGIIVRRTDEDGQPAVATTSQDVGSIQNEQDPWVWSRSWVLSPAGSRPTTGSDIVISEAPATNIDYGTKHHIAIDQKTARRVSSEERLFLTVTAWELPLNQTSALGNTTDSNVFIYGLMPYRVLGRVFTNAGNRRNASR